MSAGGLSYDCLVTSRKVTLPSVEMWGTNMNILKDPPRSLYTRRIDKVGDTQQILLAQEDSGDRIAECINVYARGVNPMVSVSYDNNSNNAGARGSILNYHPQAKLPYKPEVFYPPVFRQEDLVPLSRQPRNWFYALSNPEIPNIVHQMSCPETKSSVWNTDRVLHADAPARIQYNNEAPLTNSELPPTHSTLKQEELHPDRFFATQPQREEQVWMQNSHGNHQKNIHDDIAHLQVHAGKSVPSAGSDREMIQSCHPKSIQDNKLLYQVFSQKSGNRNLRDARDLVQTIQTRALQQDPLPVHYVVPNHASAFDSGMDASYHQSSPSSFGNTVQQQLLQYPADSQVSGTYMKDQQVDAPMRKHEASHDYLYKEVQTKPTQTYFWKQAEGQARGANPKTIREEVMHREHVAAPQMGHLEKRVLPSHLDSRAIRDQVLHPEHDAAPQMGYLEKTISHTSLAKEPVRNLPNFKSETNKKGLYTKQHVQPDHMGGGRIEHDRRHTAVEAPRSVPSSVTNIDDFRNVPLSIREDPMRTSVTSVMTRDKTSLQDVLYGDTVHPVMRSNLPSTEAFSHKTSYDHNGEMGTMELLPKRIPHMETSTARDTSAMGHDLYQNQSTDAARAISHAPSAGSMEPTPSNVPLLHRQYDHGSERPIMADRDVRNRASAQYFERFSVPPNFSSR
jgi:hypothetical protein